MVANKKPPKTRSVIVLIMILTRKAGKHRDKKHDGRKKACRGKVKLDD